MLKLKLQYFSHLIWKADLLEKLTPWKRPWCWERLRVGEEGGDRGWDGWMAPLTPWTWVWANSGIQQRTGKPGVLQSMGSQRVGHDWATEWYQHEMDNKWESTIKLSELYCALRWPKWEEIPTRGGMHICVADSPCCTAETNATLWSNYMPVKIDFKNCHNFDITIFNLPCCKIATGW